jgi:hypothetical protein
MVACLAAVAGYAIWHARRIEAPVPILTAESNRPPVAPVAQASATPAADAAKAIEPTTARAKVRDALRSRDTARGSLRKFVAPAATPPPAPPAPAPTDIKAAAPPPPPAPKFGAIGGNVSLESGASRANNRPMAPAQAPQLETQTNVSQQNAPSNQTESITVSADAVAVQVQEQVPSAAPKAKELKSDFPMKSAASGFLDTQPEVKWSALRRERDGSLSPVETDQIRAGDSIVLRLEPYADGYLSVVERLLGSGPPRVVLGMTSVQRAKAVDVPAVTLDHAGVQELLVEYTAPALRTRQNTLAKDSLPSPQTITLHYR